MGFELKADTQPLAKVERRPAAPSLQHRPSSLSHPERVPLPPRAPAPHMQRVLHAAVQVSAADLLRELPHILPSQCLSIFPI